MKKRFPKDAFQKKAKLMEEPPSPKVANKKIVRTPTVPKGPRVDVAKHVMMIRKAASENDLKRAMSIFDSLKESGAEMNSVIYNTVLDACVKCWELKAAHAWMEQTRAAGFIDVVTYNTLMKT